MYFMWLFNKNFYSVVRILLIINLKHKLIGGDYNDIDVITTTSTSGYSTKSASILGATLKMK